MTGRRNKRGFRVYSESKDTEGTPFTVSESSNALERCVRIYVHDPEYRHTDPRYAGLNLSPCLHLNEAQARRILIALTKFLEGR